MTIIRLPSGVIIMLVLLALTACSDDSRLDPLPDDAVILAYGDSLTKGTGVIEADSYPAVLADLTGREVINAGVPGEITEKGLARLTDVIDGTTPSLMVLMHGGNDILQNRSSSEAEANLGQMIELAKKQGVQVVLIGIPEKKLFSSVAPLYKHLAKDHDLVFEDSIIASLIKKPAMKSDSVHFNKAGYRAIAERIETLLRDNGAI